MATAAEQSQNTAKYWLKQITLADKRMKKYLDSAKEVVELYEAQNQANNEFNILYSNTETLLPALYNALPRPIAQRRYKDADPVSKAVCDTITRALEYTIDTPDAQYEPFNGVIGDAVLGALVPGMGISWFRYDFQSEKSEKDPDVAKEIAADGTTADSGDLTGEAQVDTPQEKVVYESVCAESVSY